MAPLTPQAPPPSPDDPAPDDREPLARRHRTVLAVTLGVAVVIAVVVGALLVANTSSTPPRAVTIPKADRSASPSLIRAAEAVNFKAPSTSGLGSIETGPVSAARPASNPNLLKPGTKAPDWTLQTPAGERVKLSDFRGKALLVEFFAAWCPHCAAEAPHLAELSRKLPASKYAVVAINADNEDAATVYAYHVYFGLPFPALLDGTPGGSRVTYPTHGPPGPTASEYQVAYYPTFYVIDPKGKVAYATDGEQPNALLEQELRRAAGE